MKVNTDKELLSSVTALWGLELEDVRPEMPVQGSPERSLRRTVVVASGAMYLLEELSPASVHRKRVIAARLARLAGAGLPVAAPLAGPDGEHVRSCAGSAWQLSPYVCGIAPEQGSYWMDAWRGEALARYLADMRRAATGMNLNETPFDLADHVRRIEADTRKLHPTVHAGLAPVFRMLDRKLADCGRLPVTFSHGDPHPLNVIWGTNCILAVIDWEFCGPKCSLYDPALVLGCVGSEDENALEGPFAKAFTENLRTEGLLNDGLEEHLPTHTLALRTAWLAEWLRRGDTEAAEFEIFYMTELARRFF